MTLPPFYSQNGEDVVLAALFPQPAGTFVEVGCIDGRRFSNSYHFELRGWKGLCVEAHRDYIPLLKQRRPRSIVVHAAVASTDQASVTFYANARGSLSTLDASKEQEFRNRFGKWFTGFRPQEVPQRRLSSILDASGLGPIDFLSIDIEGLELDALRGIDFVRHRPKVLVLEIEDAPVGDAIRAYLVPSGYRPIGSVMQNSFFAESQFELPPALLALPAIAELHHTPLPMDEPVETVVRVEVDWRPHWA